MSIITDYPNIINNKLLNRITSLEFVTSEKCQNKCDYCYRVKKHNQSQILAIKPELVELFCENFLEIFNLDKSYFSTLACELFGGDAMIDYQKLKGTLDILINKMGFEICTIPTNARMVQELANPDLEDLMYVANGKMFLSLSVDGEPQDNQRSLSKYGKMLAYEEKINYDKLMKLSEKYHFGFHPMLTFKSIDTWFDTVKFFKQYNNLPYLLEVRHPISREDSIKAVEEIVKIRFFVEDNFPQEIVRKSNTLCLSLVPRGLGCSALTTMTIMPNGDMPFCHRVVDEPWVYANLLTKQFNLDKAVTMISGYDHRNHPLCMDCSIRTICSGQCAGASYEYWGDPWIPIDSICNFNKLKTYIMAEYFSDWENIYNCEYLDSSKNEFEKEMLKLYGEENLRNLRNLK